MHKKFRILFSLPVVSTLSLLMVGCANPFANNASEERAALPKSWYQLPENGGPQKPAERNQQPTAEMSETVRTAFSVHTGALAELEEAPTLELDSNFALVLRPANYTPWHLDGMIANFAVSGGGLFGPLMLDGEASVKATWRRVAKKKSATHGFAAKAAVAKKPAAFKFRSAMTDKDIAKMLEPAVRSAVATKAVRNERAFRHNLNQQGKSFAKMARLMNRVPSRRGWHVHGYELKLAFTAEGQVSATMGVGGSLAVYFKWEEEEKSSLLEAEPLLGLDEVLFGNLVSFTRTMASLIPEALNDAAEIRRSGFELEEFTVGIGLTVGGDIGVASVEGSVDGKMIFASDNNDHGFTDSEINADQQGSGEDFVPMVASQVPSQEHLAYAQMVGTSIESLASGQMVYRVARSRFRSGMKEALTMGAYFAGEGRKEDTASWKLAELETEFQASIGGDVSIVTVSGRGNFALIFERVGL